MKMLTEIGEEENVESYIHNALQNKVKIMGFTTVYMSRVIRVQNIYAKCLRDYACF